MKTICIYALHALLWMGAAQGVPAAAMAVGGQDSMELIKAAGLYAVLFAAVFSLGGMRYQMAHTNQFVTLEMTRMRDDMGKGFAGMDRHFITVDSLLAAGAEQRVEREQWQARTEARIESIERRLGNIEAALPPVRVAVAA